MKKAGYRLAECCEHCVHSEKKQPVKYEPNLFCNLLRVTVRPTNVCEAQKPRPEES
jgi:hypothetical protein